MPPETEEQEIERLRAARPQIWGKGFLHVVKWIFEKNGKFYDLSAADLTQLDRIEEEGLFLSEDWNDPI